MTMIKTRISVAPDGTFSGRGTGLPPGEHEAEIIVSDAAAPRAGLSADELLVRVRAIQAEISQLPVLDTRGADEILGYNERGHFD